LAGVEAWSGVDAASGLKCGSAAADGRDMNVSSIASQADTANQLSMIMAKKAQDQMRSEGQAALQMLDSASKVGTSKPASALIGTGGVTSGGRVDMYA